MTNKQTSINSVRNQQIKFCLLTDHYKQDDYQYSYYIFEVQIMFNIDEFDNKLSNHMAAINILCEKQFKKIIATLKVRGMYRGQNSKERQQSILQLLGKNLQKQTYVLVNNNITCKKQIQKLCVYLSEAGVQSIYTIQSMKQKAMSIINILKMKALQKLQAQYQGRLQKREKLFKKPLILNARESSIQVYTNWLQKANSTKKQQQIKCLILQKGRLMMDSINRNTNFFS